MSKIQPIYLQCEDLHCVDLKLHRKNKTKQTKQKTPGISKNDNAKTEGDRKLRSKKERAVVKGES